VQELGGAEKVDDKSSLQVTELACRCTMARWKGMEREVTSWQWGKSACCGSGVFPQMMQHRCHRAGSGLVSLTRGMGRTDERLARVCTTVCGPAQAQTKAVRAGRLLFARCSRNGPCMRHTSPIHPKPPQQVHPRMPSQSCFWLQSGQQAAGEAGVRTCSLTGSLLGAEPASLEAS
jgi:hypothetical protein